MKKTFFVLAAATAALLSLNSCGGKVTPGSGSDTPEVVIGESVELPANGGTYSLEFIAQNNWSIVKDASNWLNVSPVSGAAGANALSLSFDKNESLSERSSNIMIIDGAKQTKYKITQKCPEVFNVPQKDYALTNQEVLTVKVNSNIEFTVSTDASWITLPTPATISGSISTINVDFGIAKFEGGAARNGQIFIEAVNGKKITVTVSQNLAFYKQLLGYRFTGTWCGYCPYLANGIQMFEEQTTGRLNVMCFYDSSSSASVQGSSSTTYNNTFGITGYPTLILDERGEGSGLSNTGFKAMIAAFLKESLASYQALTGIEAKAELSGSTIKVSGKVHTLQAGTYHIHVAVMEDGVVAAQSDYTGLYTSSQLTNWAHNGVVRDHITTKNSGNAITFEQAGEQSFEFSANVPSSVKNNSNIVIAIYVTREKVTGPKAAAYTTYKNYRGEMVDNSVFVKIGESVELKYE